MKNLFCIVVLLCSCVIAEDQIIFDFSPVYEDPQKALDEIQKEIDQGDHSLQNYIYSGAALIATEKFDEAVKVYAESIKKFKQRKNRAVLYALQAHTFAVWAQKNKRDNLSFQHLQTKALKKIKRAVAYAPTNIYLAQMFKLYSTLAEDKLEQHIAIDKIKQIDPNGAGKEVSVTLGTLVFYTSMAFASGILVGMYVEAKDETRRDVILGVMKEILISMAFKIIETKIKAVKLAK